MTKYEYLLDSAFLRQVDYANIKTLYCRIILLNNNEDAIAAIEGKATGGQISVNSSSAVRRSGSVTLVADENSYKITDIRNLISIDKMMELEVGIDNKTGSYVNYPILWFPLGQFVIGGANVNHSAQGVNISVTLKDKMARLNGEIGGTLTTAITHSPIYYYPTSTSTDYAIDNVHFRTLIYNLLTEYGGLSKDKILIEDVDLRIKNLVRWLGANPIYIGVDATGAMQILNSPPEDTNNWIQEPIKIQTNENMGYTFVDFTYPGELSSSAGESVVSVLDKLKDALGNFEYFFDVNGIFHFQMIKNYLNEGAKAEWLEEALNEKYFQNIGADKSVYTFADGAINTSYQNTPQYSLIKNDIVIWGQLPESKIPIRYHVAIDRPPKVFHTWVVTWEEQTLSNRVIKRAKTARLAQANESGVTPTDWRAELYFEYISDKVKNLKYYAKELEEELPKFYDLEHGGQLYTNLNLEDLTWFFDMIDPDEIADRQIKQIAIESIGLRPKAIVDNSIDCLFNFLPPDYCFIDNSLNTAEEITHECEAKGENYYLLSAAAMNQLGLGTSHNAAFDLLRSIFHESIGYTESISLQTIPVYYLEPNTRITVEDQESDIHGDYIINSISIPLAANGIMSINAQRAVERI